MGEYCVIQKEELKRLLTESHILNCLERDGVDNWTGYMEGRDEYINSFLAANGITMNNEDDIDFDDLAEIEIKDYPTIS